MSLQSSDRSSTFTNLKSATSGSGNTIAQNILSKEINIVQQEKEKKQKCILTSHYFDSLSDERTIIIDRSDCVFWVENQIYNLIEFAKKSGLEKDEKYSSIYLKPASSILEHIKDDEITLSPREMAWLMLVVTRQKQSHINACKRMSTEEGKELTRWLEKEYDKVYDDINLSLPKPS